MNPLTLFRRRPVTETNATQSEPTATARLRALQARLGQVREEIRAGNITEELALEEKELLTRITALDQVAQAERNRVYRAALDRKAEEFLARKDATMSEVGELISRLQFRLLELRDLIAEAHEGGAGSASGGTMEELIGVPADFPEKMQRAIVEAAPNTEWHVDWMNGSATPPPTLRGAPHIMLHAKQKDIHGNYVRPGSVHYGPPAA